MSESNDNHDHNNDLEPGDYRQAPFASEDQDRDEVYREIRQELLVIEETNAPIPPPTMLARYDQIIPNGAERLMAMAESQQEHRIDMERTVIQSNISSRTQGLWIGGFVIVFALSLSAFLVWHGRDISGSIIAIGTLITAFAAYNKGIDEKRSRGEED